MYKDIVRKFAETPSEKKKVIVIYWPTGSGKTDMSIEIAQSLDTEIISTDSRQIFTYMDIGTGKITPEEMQGVKHHMLDVVTPDEEYSLWDFKQSASKVMNSLHSKGKIPMLVWGTGLYIDSLIFDFKLPQIPADKQLREELWKLSKEDLYKHLMEIDPEYAAELHQNNRPYVERAIEVKTLTGKSKKDFREEKTLKYDVLFLSPDYGDRDNLYNRINLRVGKMFESGAVQEVEKLIEMGYGEDDFWMNSIGYREFFPYFRWEISRDELIDTIRQNSRNYAKRQLTWFRKYNDYL